VAVVLEQQPVRVEWGLELTHSCKYSKAILTSGILAASTVPAQAYGMEIIHRGMVKKI
jgi:hypothetical protein